MIEKSNHCLHDKQFNDIIAVRVNLQCKNCGEYYHVWLKDTNLQVVKNELEYEL